MRIQLSDHFTYGRLLRFVAPSAVMMIFTSVYSVVDGLFVSNYAGKTPFASLNLIYPFLMILGAVGFMIGTGGAAVVGKTLGEGRREKANEYFSMLVYSSLVCGIIFVILGQIFIRRVAVFLGAGGEMIDYCVIYGRIILLGLPFFMLQYVFQTLFVTAEKPKLGLAVTVAAGCANIVLDALFVAGFKWGLAGAAAATAISQTVGGALPIIYFLRKNDSLLRLTKSRFYGRIFLKVCTNGSSELMSNIAASVVTMLYNFQLMRLAGENGIAAYGVIMYVAFIFAAIFIGYSIGSAPVVSYNYGAGNKTELRNVLKKSIVLNALSGILLMITAVSLSGLLSKLFTGYDAELCRLTERGLRLYSISFVLSGFNIFGSSFFTALNNGAVSAAISFLRTMVFETGSVIILPAILGVDGIWLAISAAETAAFTVTVTFMVTKRKKYGYGG